ncbi:hypothetical protein JCM33374_g6049 [Metschnikowia sp. JCM 33374]|nr:hypothetical protein JCM33374_g6049 [Metschnikowia sp. JCM 33374]
MRLAVAYFYQNSELWLPLLAVCIPAALVSIIVFSILAVTVFPVYALIATTVTGPFGLISAIITLFSLTRQLTILISQLLFIRHIQGIIFEKVLEREGAKDLLLRYRFMRSRFSPQKPIDLRLRYQTLPFLERELFYFLLGIIPLIGPLIVLFFKAPVKGYKTHKRYYKLMVWEYVDINRFYREYRRDYAAFGVVALLLEMIPGLTILFMFTSNIGMALWTAQYHKDFEEFMADDNEELCEKAHEMKFWRSTLEEITVN